MDWYWNGLLEIPLELLYNLTGFDVGQGFLEFIVKLVMSIIPLLLIWEVTLRIKKGRKKRQLRKELNEEKAKMGGGDGLEHEHIAKMEAVHAPKQTKERLKKNKDWIGLARVCVSLNENQEAAKYYKKGGDLQNAATQLAKAGKILPAAKMFLKAEDFVLAARYFKESGKTLESAQAWEKAGNKPQAATVYIEAGKLPEAVRLFSEFFAEPHEDTPEQLEAADCCRAALQNQAFQQEAGQDRLVSFALAAAQRFEVADRPDAAAPLFQQAGQPAHAGEMYLKAGNLEAAAKCMEAAGKTKEAKQIGARFYEQRQLWKEAAMAYEGAEEYQKAGECYSRCNNAAKTAECYTKSGEYFGAGFANVHLHNWSEAVELFQHLKEDHPKFGESRMLMGRCFYELRDYEHCVATLDNHLYGDKVTNDNIEYFWMLALAQEQLGNLSKSKELLQKIQTLKMDFRDVGQRLSSIDTRISMAGERSPSAMAGQTGAGTNNQATAVMDMVSNQVGTRYKLEKELGRGGMGVVYLAKDVQLERTVALKFLGSLVDGSQEFKQRFIREARAAAKVNHPNVISIFDIGTQEGGCYIAMEFIEGPDLGKYVRRKGKLVVREAVNIMKQACSALDAVHEAGIIHRDIKPDNIILSKGGLVKLMDFGLAKSEGPKLTGTNVVMGTPCYMSPEQAMGKPVDGRTDIYAMGLVLHEMLSGKTVFATGNVLERQVKEVPPKPSETTEDVPEALDAIVMKAVEKNVDDRYQTAKEFYEALQGLGM